jgi:hypothetical protein
MIEKFDLIKYRDAGMNTYTYFWKDKSGKTISPYFDIESEAHQWINLKAGAEQMSDKGYSVSTHEKQAEFAKKRNYTGSKE